MVFYIKESKQNVHLTLFEEAADLVLYQLFRIGIHLKNIIQLWKKKCAKKYNSIKIVTKHQKLSYSICFSTSIWNKIPFHQLKRLQQLLIPIDLHHILHGQPPIAEIPPPRSLLPQFSRLGPHSLSVGLLHGHPPPPILHTPKQTGQAILRRLDGPREALLKALASPDNVVHLLEGAEAAVGEADRVEVHFGVVLLFEVSSFDESAQFVYILELDRVGEQGTSRCGVRDAGWRDGVAVRPEFLPWQAGFFMGHFP